MPIYEYVCSKCSYLFEVLQSLNEKDLLVDIFSLNDLDTDTVRLNASTIKQLFEDTDYSLKEVREKKLVKPIALTLLPNEIKMIENVKKRSSLDNEAKKRELWATKTKKRNA